MAKLTAPLLSFDARGQLAKTLVYSGWKGIKDVRTYVIPANPRSAGQQTQRSYFSLAVGNWHNDGLAADDFAAWNRAASVAPSPRSGFNDAVSFAVAAEIAGHNNGYPHFVINGAVTDSGAGQVDLTAEDPSGNADSCTFRWGYSPTSLINEIVVPGAGPVFSSLNVAVASGAQVYMQANMFTTGLNIERSGIYKFGPTS